MKKLVFGGLLLIAGYFIVSALYGCTGEGRSRSAPAATLPHR